MINLLKLRDDRQVVLGNKQILRLKYPKYPKRTLEELYKKIAHAQRLCAPSKQINERRL